MRILAIETSCDDTCVAILKASKNGGFKILSNIVASQIEIHKKYGGVYPFMAKREHQKNLEPTLKLALKKAKIKDEKNIDLIAITVGPGLEPCLWVGLNFAKELAKKWNKSLIPINHIEAHILVNFLDLPAQAGNKEINLPAICLVVSGGHTQLILMKDIGKYKILGETRDDAAGECFDKCAKILGLGYPGGPAIAELARQWKSQIPSTKSQTNPKPQIQNSKFEIKLPRPMINSKDYDFSFSGLKTAVLYHHKKQAYPNSHDRRKSCMLKYRQEMSAEIQQAIIDVLIKKTIKAAKDFNAKTIILGGGVSANEELRKQFLFKIQDSKFEIQFLAPPASLCTDNAVMTAIAGYFHKNKKIDWKKIKADGNLRIK